MANVIPDYTKAFWQVRSPSLKGLNVLVGKLRNCIEAGALATGCQVKIDEYVIHLWSPAHLPIWLEENELLMCWLQGMSSIPMSD